MDKLDKIIESILFVAGDGVEYFDISDKLGVTVEEVDASFFEDKDVDFLKDQVQILLDFAMINTVIESNLMNVLASSCEKALGVPLNKIKFFTNQEVILEEEEDEETDAE